MNRRMFMIGVLGMACTGQAVAHDGHAGAMLEVTTHRAEEANGAITLDLTLSNTGDAPMTIAGFAAPIGAIAATPSLTLDAGQVLHLTGADALVVTDLTRAGVGLFTLMVIFDSGAAGPVTIFMT
ncbi:hypothetical protein FHS89_001545 [Rubricella aquisinus]|uniref:Copper chaperone PCu(A)C n=1 Tax=Rubricella aquisinus TaxID=2028108 RepID=A0A840WN61_9RHOB|nr:hypothetical protein [Rubricella aquisinus]MBB5515533.1 hypothetical protein [Rubricella aquisinus]